VQRRQQCHRQRASFLARQSLQRVHKIRLEQTRLPEAPQFVWRRLRTVAVQAERRRCSFQVILPVGDLPLSNITLKMPALPDGEVGGLNGERGKCRSSTG